MICIIGAIKEEISGIKQHISIKKKYLIDASTFYQGYDGNQEVIVVRSGVGQSLAYQAACNSAKMFPLQYMISIGFAGGVTPELKISNLVLSDNILFCGNEESLFRFKKVPLSQASNLFNHGNKIRKILSDNGIKYKFGNIISINKIADSTKFKEWLGQNYPVLAVEMETASIAKIAEQQKVPFFSLRSVSDEVSHSIIWTSKFTNKKGTINKLGLACHVLTHPSLIPSTIELKRNASKAAKTLTEALFKIINSNDFIKLSAVSNPGTI